MDTAPLNMPAADKQTVLDVDSIQHCESDGQDIGHLPCLSSCRMLVLLRQRRSLAVRSINRAFHWSKCYSKRKQMVYQAALMRRGMAGVFRHECMGATAADRVQYATTLGAAIKRGAYVSLGPDGPTPHHDGKGPWR